MVIQHACALLAFLNVAALFPVVAQDNAGATNQTPRNRGHAMSFIPILSITGEDGLIIGGGPRLDRFDDRRSPFASRMELVGAVGFKSGAVLIKYNALFLSLLNNIDLGINARMSQFEIRNFYGFGNASARDKELEKSDFYRVNVTQFLIDPALIFHLSTNATFGIETVVKHFRLKQEGVRLLTASEADSLGNDITNAGIGLSVDVDTRDDQSFPRHGMLWRFEGWNSPGMFNQPGPFQKIIADFRFFGVATLWNEVVLALRMKGEKLEGKYPFQESAFLGGLGSLRGYRQQRFTGDASVFGSVDLRFSLFQTRIIVPAEIGAVLLADAGRV